MSNWVFRLPTDEEWSLAVGLEQEEGATPKEKDSKITGVYPWGTEWPPPDGAGNYADVATRRKYRGIVSVEGASGVALILVAHEGQNAIVIVPGANALLGEQDIAAAADQFAAARWVLLQLESPLATVIAAARAARTAGATVILDPAPALAALPPELLECIDYLTPNETEVAQLLGETPRSLSIVEATELAMQLLSA